MSNTPQKVYLTSRYYSVSTVDNWAKSGTNIYNINGGNVAVGSNYTSPQANFDVSGQTLLRTPIFRIGENAGLVNQSTDSIAIGIQAGMSNQDVSAVAIGFQAGMSNQGRNAVAAGYQAGMINQGVGTVAIGAQAGMSNQGINAIALGQEAGMSNQGVGGIALGYQAGQVSQGTFAIASGWQAGQNNQNANSVALGYQAGQNNQGTNSIAIGSQAGQNNQGQNSICIGTLTNSTFQNSIILNATGSQLNADAANAFYVSPIDVSNGLNNILIYDTNSGKISYKNNAKTFVINHPFNENKYLVHSCLEGPEAGVYYRGEGEITNNEYTEIELPFYTSAFKYVTIHITPLEKYTSFYHSKLSNSRFTVHGKNGRFSWFVFAKREDIDVEPLKTSFERRGQSPYNYLV